MSFFALLEKLPYNSVKNCIAFFKFFKSFVNRIFSTFTGEGHFQGAEGGAGPRQGAGAQVRDVPEGDEAEVGGGGRRGEGDDGRAAGGGEDDDGVPEVMEDQLEILVDAEGETALQRGRRVGS